jgi:hypothetical protein
LKFFLSWCTFFKGGSHEQEWSADPAAGAGIGAGGFGRLGSFRGADVGVPHAPAGYQRSFDRVLWALVVLVRGLGHVALTPLFFYELCDIDSGGNGRFHARAAQKITRVPYSSFSLVVQSEGNSPLVADGHGVLPVCYM